MFELWTFSLSRIKRVKEYEDVDQKHQKSWGHDCWGVDGKCRRKPWRCWSVKWETHFHTSPVHVKDLNWKMYLSNLVTLRPSGCSKNSIQCNGCDKSKYLSFIPFTSDLVTNHYGRHCVGCEIVFPQCGRKNVNISILLYDQLIKIKHFSDHTSKGFYLRLIRIF